MSIDPIGILIWLLIAVVLFVVADLVLGMFGQGRGTPIYKIVMLILLVLLIVQLFSGVGTFRRPFIRVGQVELYEPRVCSPLLMLPG
jgi:uncharacterized membrane protein (DUF373 family)